MPKRVALADKECYKILNDYDSLAYGLLHLQVTGIKHEQQPKPKQPSANWPNAAPASAAPASAARISAAHRQICPACLAANLVAAQKKPAPADLAGLYLAAGVFCLVCLCAGNH